MRYEVEEEEDEKLEIPTACPSAAAILSIMKESKDYTSWLFSLVLMKIYPKLHLELLHI